MRIQAQLRRTLLVLPVLCATSFLSAQDSDCRAIAALAEMASAKSFAQLSMEKDKAGTDYRSQLVFAYRGFQIRQTRVNAERLLSLIPHNEEQQTVVLTLGDSLCPAESSADMLSLSRVGEGLAHQWAKAVLIAPRSLSSYVAFALEAIGDPHSDYAVQMQQVCRQTHNDFVEATQKLSEKDRTLFRSHVINPATCKAIALPEAE